MNYTNEMQFYYTNWNELHEFNYTDLADYTDLETDVAIFPLLFGEGLRVRF